jgi:hypothetical protein
MHIRACVLLPWLLGEACSQHIPYKKLDIPVRPIPALNLSVWERELNNTKDPSKDFILSGIKHGFDIVDKGAKPKPVFSPNHPSAKPGSKLYNLVHKQVCAEIAAGNYVITSDQPTIVSPLCAIPKDENSVRLIHDASYPEGLALNDYATLTEKDKYETIETATAMMTPNWHRT